MWRIENLELAEVNPSNYGQFYGGDCYLVLYMYQRSGRQEYILYMWQVCGEDFSLWSLINHKTCNSNEYNVRKSYHLRYYII